MAKDWLVVNRNRLIAWQREHYFGPKNGDVRLHIGCGHSPWPGYVNIDPYTPEADLKADARSLPYEDGSVDEICCHHVLEHIPQRHFVATLKEWHRVLKTGGHLDLGLPDLGLCFSEFAKAPEAEKWRWWIYVNYGYQVDTATDPKLLDEAPIDEGQFHRAGVTADRLRDLLREVGFEVVDLFNYDAYEQPSIWVLAEKCDPRLAPVTAHGPSVFEQDCVMGVFTHRTTYLPALLDSVRRHLPQISFQVKIQDKPINANMEALRQDFLATGKRYWLFLDDDIQFLNGSIVHDAIFDMVKHGWACASVYSDFNQACLTRPYADELKLIPAPAVREAAWATGYFILVDSYKVGHIKPDLDLPEPNTSVDTSYSVAIRQAGYRIGFSGNVVYHTHKQTPVNWEVVNRTNTYLMRKWGQFYFDTAKYDGNVLDWRPG